MSEFLRMIMPHALWALLGAAGLYMWRMFHEWRRSRGQRALLSGLEEPLFVFPPRPGRASTLPLMAIEDFLAINNLISAYLRVGIRRPHYVKDHDKFTDDDGKKRNLILICSSKSNNATRKALERLRGSNSLIREQIPFFEEVPGKTADQPMSQIKWKGAMFCSDSYQQSPDSNIFDDVAMIVKCQNPWGDSHKILIVAGIRGIGTWGAAEFLKKWWHPLYERVGNNNFVALVQVHCENYDIKHVNLLLADPLVAQQRAVGAS